MVRWTAGFAQTCTGLGKCIDVEGSEEHACEHGAWSKEQGVRGLAEVEAAELNGTCGTPKSIVGVDELAQMAGFYVLTGSILLAVTVIFSRAPCRMRRKAFGFSYGRAPRRNLPDSFVSYPENQRVARTAIRRESRLRVCTRRLPISAATQFISQQRNSSTAMT